MECPYCGYKHGNFWDADTFESEIIYGDYDDFFNLPVTASREREEHRYDCRDVYGCPKCNKIFMKD